MDLLPFGLNISNNSEPGANLTAASEYSFSPLGRIVTDFSFNHAACKTLCRISGGTEDNI